VIQWNERGFGFIQFADGRRAYVHNTQCGGHLQEGEVVTALVVQDAQNPGKWAAEAVERESAPEAIQTIQTASRVSASRPQVWAAPVPPQPQAVPEAYAEAGLDERQEGFVSSWNERGFGFIQCNDGRRAYVHNSACGGERLVEGEMVSAVLVEDAKNPGKWAAQALQRGPAGEDGVVGEWREEHGYGFLTMEDGRRAYIHRSAFGGTGGLVVGSRLRVRTGPDPRNPGKWSVSEVLGGVAASPAAAKAPVATSQRMPIGLPPSTPLAPVAPMAPAAKVHHPRSAPAVVMEEGIVAEWREEHGYGFMQMDDGRKAYVHRSAFGGAGSLSEGSRYQVVTKPDARNPGKWCVASVHAELPAQSQARWGAKAHAPMQQMQPMQPMQPVGEEGVVGEWLEESGYGFMHMDDGRRAYVHRSALGAGGSLVVGSRLRVALGPDARNPGKWCVSEVLAEVQPGQQAPAPLPGRPEPLGSPGAGSEVGLVTDWNDAGGYGFLQLQNGRRAYIHRSVLGAGGSLIVGMRLSVVVQPDQRNPGKWSVAEVSGDGLSFGGPGGSFGESAGLERTAKRQRLV